MEGSVPLCLRSTTTKGRVYPPLTPPYGPGSETCWRLGAPLSLPGTLPGHTELLPGHTKLFPGNTKLLHGHTKLLLGHTELVLEQQDLVPDQTRPKNTSYFHYFVMNEHPIGAMKV